jgi:3-hydroxyisobutyrate dehydrogenase
MRSVAFLGLGVMGGGMAKRAAGLGGPIALWNRSRERADGIAADLASPHVRVAATPREAAAGADVIFSMVADDPASRSLWMGPDGALAGASRGAILVESSTLSPAWIESLASEAATNGCTLVDAPVTGSRIQAASGQLLFLVGGTPEIVERLRPLLAVMSRGIVHVGPTGSGARLKLVNNFVCGVQAVALAEALALIERAGLDRDVATGVLAEGAPGSPLVKSVGPRMMHADYAVHFGLDLMRKDLSYAIDEARRFGLDLTTATAARERFARASAAGFGLSDFSAVAEAVRQTRGAPEGTEGRRQ